MESISKTKSFLFAKRIVRLYQHMVRSHKEYHLSSQVLRSGTSIGANIEEATGAQTKKDFFAKMCIAHKEARETHYWIRLLTETGYIKESDSTSSLLNDCEELLRLTGSTTRTVRTQLDS